MRSARFIPPVVALTFFTMSIYAALYGAIFPALVYMLLSLTLAIKLDSEDRAFRRGYLHARDIVEINYKHGLSSEVVLEILSHPPSYETYLTAYNKPITEG